MFSGSSRRRNASSTLQKARMQLKCKVYDTFLFQKSNRCKERCLCSPKRASPTSSSTRIWTLQSSVTAKSLSTARLLTFQSRGTMHANQCHVDDSGVRHLHVRFLVWTNSVPSALLPDPFRVDYVVVAYMTFVVVCWCSIRLRIAGGQFFTHPPTAIVDAKGCNSPGSCECACALSGIYVFMVALFHVRFHPRLFWLARRDPRCPQG